ncbi:MAG: Protease 3 [Chlamydiae bacterium]|nr:Protease 3 [Chlamydiota bacterium]
MKKILYLIFLFTTHQICSLEVIEDRTTIPVLAPSFQKSETKKIKLDNDIEAYLISDPNAEKSAVVLSVNAGSWEDPLEHPGLAHFLEHMLFMGTKKYPDEASFSRFIKQHGGMSNAFTEDQYTTYLFEINSDGFPEALDRFSQFFIEPSLNPSGISREIQAVEQEFSGHSQKDDSRRVLIYKEHGNPKHPFSKFNFGNQQSLRKATTDDLRKWYEKNYSANKMKLILYSPLGIDELVKLANVNFSSIPNIKLGKHAYPFSIFSPTLHGKILYVEPVKNQTSIMMVWELPKKFAEATESRPDELVCHILGHEGKESLLAQLQRDGTALELGCGTTRWGDDNLAFIIKIELTAKGAKNPYDVVTRVFQAIARLKQVGIPEYLFKEVQRVGTIKYQYPLRKSPFEEVKKHSRNLRYEPLATYPEVTTILQQYEPKLIRELLNALTPDTMILDLMAPSRLTGVTPDRKEKWMKTEYAIREIPKNVLQKWNAVDPHPQIDIPAPNLLIPTDLKVYKNHEKESKLIIDNEYGKVYFAPDSDYHVPKISWTIQIQTPSINVGRPQAVVLTDIFLKIIKQQLTPFTYLARVAELEYEIKQEDHGLKITVNGYSDNAALFLKEILNQLTQLDVDEEVFETYRESVKNKYHNIEQEAPYIQGIDVFKKVIYERYSTEREKEAVAKKVTFQEFQNFVAHLFDKTYIEAMFFGNLNHHQAELLWGELKVVSGQPYPPSQQPQKTVGIFPDNQGPFFLKQPSSVKGSAVIVAIEDPNFSFENYAAQDILWKMTSGPFFEELRTKQQTAYLIANLHEEVKEKFFSLFLLQSYSYPPRDLLARIELFIENFLKNIPEEQFETIKQALINELKTQPESLKKRGTELAEMAFDRDGDFEWNEKRAKAAKELTFDEFRSYVANFLGKGNKRRLAILIEGQLAQDVLEYSPAENVKWLRTQVKY